MGALQLLDRGVRGFVIMVGSRVVLRRCDWCRGGAWCGWRAIGWRDACMLGAVQNRCPAAQHAAPYVQHGPGKGSCRTTW